LFYASKRSFERPDCRMIDCKVPIFISLWLGTGIVVVDPTELFLHDNVATFLANFGKPMHLKKVAQFSSRKYPQLTQLLLPFV